MTKVPDSSYHQSVLLEESVNALITDPNGVYVDATYGGGGHTAALLSRLGSNAKMVVFDQDEEAWVNVIEDSRLIVVKANFSHLYKFLRLHNVIPVNGILADLGVSSWQLNTPERGFSYRFDGPLDMRMNVGENTTAADVLNFYPTEKLLKIFTEFGEVSNAKSLVKAIDEFRLNKKFDSTIELKIIAESTARGNVFSYLSQVFQAVRIEVNHEFDALESFLKQCAEVLKPEGKLAVITFHSLEEKFVKNFMRYGTVESEAVKDDFGRIDTPLRLLTKSPILPSHIEVKRNPRARSAKLRVAIKK